MCQDRKTALELCLKYKLNNLYNFISDENNNLEKIFSYIKYHQSEEIVQAIIESNNDYWKYRYCLEVEDRHELWSTITDDQWRYVYCLYVEDRRELWSAITDDYYKYEYCKYIEDRTELSSTFFGSVWKELYCAYVKDRKKNTGVNI